MNTDLLLAAAAVMATIVACMAAGCWKHALLLTNTINRTTGCHSYLLGSMQNFLCTKRDRPLWKTHSVLLCRCLIIGYDASRLGQKMNMPIFHHSRIECYIRTKCLTD